MSGKRTGLVSRGIATSVVLGVVGVVGVVVDATPARAVAVPLTSVYVTPAQLKFGQPLTVIFNGDPTADVGFNGCSVQTINGVVTISDDIDIALRGVVNYPIVLLGLPADGLDLETDFYVDTNCAEISGLTPLTTHFVIEPAVHVSDVTLRVGQESSSNIPVTYNVFSGYDFFVNGGAWAEVAPESCTTGTVELPTSSQFPAGTTVDDGASLPGDESPLRLRGTPEAGSEGHYDACVAVFNGPGALLAHLRIDVEAVQLPSTGIDEFSTSIAAGIAAGATSLGILALVVFWRRTGTRFRARH